MRLLMYFRNRSLKVKLALFLLLLVILPLMASGVYFNYYFVNSMLEHSYQNHLSTVRQTEKSFVPILLEMENLSYKMISNDNLQSQLLMKERGESDGAFEEKNDLLRWVSQEKIFCSYVDSIQILQHGELFLSVGKTTFHADDSLRSFEASQASNIFGLESRQRTSFGEGYVMHYLQKLRNLNNIHQEIGVLKLIIPEELLRKAYASLYLQPGSQTLLLDETGVVISSSREEWIGGPHPGEASLLQNFFSGRAGYQSCVLEDTPHVAFYFPIANSPWVLVQYLPREVFTPVQRTANLVILAAVSLCVVFGIFFSLLLRKVIVTPIDKLLAEMRKLPHGIFTVDLTGTGEDEIGRIRRQYATIVGELKEMIDTVYVSEIKKQEAEAIALEAQINPHFLYNSLDSIHWLAIKNKDYEIAEQLEALSDVFKHILSRGREMVSIEKELDYVQSYLFLQISRYGNRIKLQIEMEDEFLLHPIPKLIIQPLVENAILHGLESKISGGKILLSIHADNGNLCIQVLDDGCGANAQDVMKLVEGDSNGKRISALANIHARLQLRYGPDYGLTFSSKEGKTAVTLRLPLMEDGNEAVDRR